MVENMKRVASSDQKLTVEERNFLLQLVLAVLREELTIE